MGDLQRYVGGCRAADRLGDRLASLVGKIADVGGVEPVRAVADVAERGDLLLGASSFEPVLQAGGVAECTRLQALLQQPLRLRQLGGVGSSVAHPGGGQAEIAVGDQGGDVDRRALLYLGRRTGSLGRVVSGDAVGDGDAHLATVAGLGPVRSRPTPPVAAPMDTVENGPRW